MRSIGTFAIGLFAFAGYAQALIVNPAQPITQQVEVNLIQVRDNAGANAAPLFGTVAQQNAIFGFIDTIWAQAGVDVVFQTATTYDSTFALSGTPGSNNPRPTGDLNTIVTNAAAAGGILDPNPNVLNLFMVQIVPGFSQTSNNTSNGLAFVGGNGITFWAGPNLPSFVGGQEVVAAVLAHEIGHNLGLNHIVEAENLMQAGGSANQGERLNAAQIQTALASPFTVAIPEPASLSALIACIAAVRRRRRL